MGWIEIAVREEDHAEDFDIGPMKSQHAALRSSLELPTRGCGSCSSSKSNGRSPNGKLPEFVSLCMPTPRIAELPQSNADYHTLLLNSIDFIGKLLRPRKFR
jgi:hypothetical protein